MIMRRFIFVLAVCLLPTQASAVDTVVFLTTTGASTWSVPSDWTSTNKIECYAAGGGGPGSTTFGGGTAPGGAGGGVYTSISNISAATLGGIGANINIGVGTGGTGGTGGLTTLAAGVGTAGGNTWFNATSLANAIANGNTLSCGSQGGQVSTTVAGGLGGAAASSVGVVAHNGGAGGASANFQGVGAGGGGAGGPQGDGGTGGATGTGDNFGGSGGGGSGGGGSGTNGSAGVQSTTTAGAAGGNNAAGAGAGASVAVDTAANPGTVGGGGSGGGGNTAGTARVGGAGGPGADATSNPGGASGGAGGGAGAGGGSVTGGDAGGNGGAGGNYGGAGGGGSFGITALGNGGAGANGIIIITYTPAVSGVPKNQMLMGINYTSNGIVADDLSKWITNPPTIEFQKSYWMAAAHGNYVAAGSPPVVTAATFYTYSPATNTQAVGTVSATNSPTSFAITAGNAAGDFAISSGGAITVTAQGATDLAGATALVSYSLTVTATNAAGTSSGVSIPISVYADGFANASAGSVQHATLLNGYHAGGGSSTRAKGNGYQPPWNAAGVDYAVGYNSVPSQDPATIAISGTSVNTSTRTVSVTGNNVTIDGYDFSLHSGYVVEIQSGATNTTITNCNFANGTNNDVYLIFGKAGASGITVKYNTIQGGTSSGNNSSLIHFDSSGTHVVQYNWINNFRAHAIEFGQASSVTFTGDVRWNMMEIGGIVASAHLNYIQFNAGTASAFNADFNTVYQTVQPSTGEVFQIATGIVGPLTLNNPSVSYNALISSGASVEVSTFIHGPVGDANNTTTGAGVVTSNYFDLTAATQAYYGGSFTSAAWTVSGGKNMVTGAAISYPFLLKRDLDPAANDNTPMWLNKVV